MNTLKLSRPIPYGRQTITDEDINAVIETLSSDFLTQGPKVEEFEKKFAEYIGCKYAVAVANGTAALHLSTLALGVKEGSRVITTPITFAASANCVRYCGGTIEFVDIDPSTALIDIEAVEKLLRSKPKGYYSGVIPVDFAGLPVNLEKLKALADEFGIWIIEDACHAPGGYFTDSRGETQNCGNGNYADLAIFSFHPVKHIATGEGGMVTTNSKDLYEKLILLRTHGITKNPSLLSQNHGGWYYEMQVLGFNYRMPDMLTALGISQLSRANAGIVRRQKIADRYFEAFSHNSRIELLNNRIVGVQHGYHLFIVKVKNRSGLYDYLRSCQIFAQVHYIPVHTMPYYESLGWAKGDFPLAEGYYEKCLSLPMFPGLTDEEQDFVISKVLEFLNR
jgi:UDP-4-amino-4,6-dideoxy-N-acetyl-beta-L-altrosamine transaminase